MPPKTTAAATVAVAFRSLPAIVADIEDLPLETRITYNRVIFLRDHVEEKRAALEFDLTAYHNRELPDEPGQLSQALFQSRPHGVELAGLQSTLAILEASPHFADGVARLAPLQAELVATKEELRRAHDELGNALVDIDRTEQEAKARVLAAQGGDAEVLAARKKAEEAKAKLESLTGESASGHAPIPAPPLPPEEVDSRGYPIRFRDDGSRIEFDDDGQEIPLPEEEPGLEPGEEVEPVEPEA